MAQRNPQNTALARRGETGHLSTWSPWQEMESFRRQFDDLFSRAFGYTPLSRMLPGELSTYETPVDIYETDDAVRLYAALPGVTPDAVHVDATADTVTIQGERKPLYEDEKAIQHRQSALSSSGSFSMSYTLPCEIDPNRVKATFRNGILELEMPKSEAAKPRIVKVNVQAG